MLPLQVIYKELPENQLSFQFNDETATINMAFETETDYQEAWNTIQEIGDVSHVLGYSNSWLIQQEQPLTWFTVYYLVKENCYVSETDRTLKPEKRTQVQEFLDNMGIDFVIWRGNLYVGKDAKDMRKWLFPQGVIPLYEQ